MLFGCFEKKKIKRLSICYVIMDRFIFFAFILSHVFIFLLYSNCILKLVYLFIFFLICTVTSLLLKGTPLFYSLLHYYNIMFLRLKIGNLAYFLKEKKMRQDSGFILRGFFYFVLFFRYLHFGTDAGTPSLYFA